MSASWDEGDRAYVVCSDGRERIATYHEFPDSSRGAEWHFIDGLIRRATDTIARPYVQHPTSPLTIPTGASENRDRRLVGLGFDAGWDAHVAYLEGVDR